jgi:hypothetical protein
VAPDKNSYHTREGGYPVIAGAGENVEQLGVLDHPPPRLMTPEVAAIFATLRQ